MHAIGSFVSAILQSNTPDGTMARMRFRSTLDTLLTLAIALLAVVLAVGYQVFGLWARWAKGGD